jgi:hypothetical protein
VSSSVFQNVVHNQPNPGVAQKAGISHYSVPPEVAPWQGGAPKVVSVHNAHVAKLWLACMATSGLVMVEKKIPSPKNDGGSVDTEPANEKHIFLGGHVNCYLFVSFLIAG